MAIRVRNPIRIAPIDTTDKVAVGVKLPFNTKKIFDSDYTTKDHAKSKLINLLLTIPGERINNPLFGVGLAQRLFEQEVSGDELRAATARQTAMFVPEVEIVNFTIKQTEHKVDVTCNYKLKLNNEDDSVTLSFANTNTQTL